MDISALPLFPEDTSETGVATPQDAEGRPEEDRSGHRSLDSSVQAEEGEYYISPLAFIQANAVRFSTGCVALPGARIVMEVCDVPLYHSPLTEAGVASFSSAERGRSAEVTLCFLPYTLVEEYAEIHIRVFRLSSPNTLGNSRSDPDTTERVVEIEFGSHNRFKSYSRVSLDVLVPPSPPSSSASGPEVIRIIGGGNIFFPYAEVELRCPALPEVWYCWTQQQQEEPQTKPSPPPAQQPWMRIGDYCRFATHLSLCEGEGIAGRPTLFELPSTSAETGTGVTAVDLANIASSSSRYISPSSGVASPIPHVEVHHCSFQLGAPAFPDSGAEDETDEEAPVVVWLVPTGGTRSRAEVASAREAPPQADRGCPSATSEEEQRSDQEVQQMCVIYMELYGTAPYAPAFLEEKHS